MPAVAQLLEDGPLRFTAPVTFLVGDNGSGKSTMVEAIAEGFGLDSYRGKAGRKYSPRAGSTRTPLGEVLRLDLAPAGSRDGSGAAVAEEGVLPAGRPLRRKAKA